MVGVNYDNFVYYLYLGLNYVFCINLYDYIQHKTILLPKKLKLRFSVAFHSKTKFLKPSNFFSIILYVFYINMVDYSAN